jgi:hypothetical protein
MRVLRQFSAYTQALIILFLGACGGIDKRIEQANILSHGTGFQRSVVETSFFNIVMFSKLGSKPEQLTVYIEGDGYAFIDRNRPSRNPTPKDPVSLKLALLDGAENVIYLARPCQYMRSGEDPNCAVEYWTDKRYAAEVLKAFTQVLDGLKQSKEAKKFRLVGYSGGATIATILAATRTDVVDLRTVAGNLDITTFTREHKLSRMTGSLNPIDYANSLYQVPQVHYIGSDDKVVTKAIYEHYLAAIKRYDPLATCVQTLTVKATSHAKGWQQFWAVNQPQKQPVCY